jgi:hypothetical protein
LAQRFVCYPKESDQNIPSDSEVQSVNHGVQFFDMKKLLTLDPAKPKNFSTTTDLAGWFNDLPAGRSHNVVVVSHNYLRCWILDSTLSLAFPLINNTASGDMSTCRG